MNSRRGLMAALLSLVCGGASCGWIVGEVAEQKMRQEALEKVRYGNLDTLWKEA
ncbi:MAG: hypothetical protein JKY37_03375, partial [Nannocystaceae bacterium]|nr:hypothetical protein [Nannocystaceae bacterium]